MRMHAIEVPGGGKPILVISEMPGAKGLTFDAQDEDRFLERTGLGGVIVTEHAVDEWPSPTSSVVGPTWTTTGVAAARMPAPEGHDPILCQCMACRLRRKGAPNA